MRTKTANRWVAVAILIIAAASENAKPLYKSGSDASIWSEAQHNNQMEKSLRFSVVSKSCKKFQTYFESEKKENRICKVKNKLDLTNGHAKNDNRHSKFFWTGLTTLIRKLLATFWFPFFLGNTCPLITYIYRLATSDSRDMFLLNLSTVQVVLAVGRIQLLVLSSVKQEWKFGNISFTTNEFTIRYLGVACFCSIMAMAFSLHRLG